MKPIFVFSIILAIIDTIWCLCWFGFGIYVQVHDKSAVDHYFIEHILLLFHFPATIAIFLACEAFRSIKAIKHGSSLCVDYRNGGYVMGWLLTFFIALSSDTFTVVHLALFPHWADAAFFGIFVLACCAAGLSVLEMMSAFRLLWIAHRYTKYCHKCGIASSSATVTSEEIVVGEGIGPCHNRRFHRR